MSCNCQCQCKQNQSDSNDSNKKYTIQHYKNLFVVGVSTLELLNELYDPCGYNLKGWTSYMASILDDYSKVFGKLYEKYKNVRSKPLEPEAELGLKIIVDGTTYHITQTFFNKS